MFLSLSVLYWRFHGRPTCSPVLANCNNTVDATSITVEHDMTLHDMTPGCMFYYTQKIYLIPIKLYLSSILTVTPEKLVW